MGLAHGLTCTRTELIYLASLRGGAAVVGLGDDPLRGRSPEEVEEALLLARDALAARRVLAIEADRAIALDYDVARLIDAVARPRMTFFAIVVGAVPRVFHTRGSVAVEIVAGDLVELVPLAGRMGVAAAVCAAWALDDQPAALGGLGGLASVVPQEAMHVAARLATSAGAAAAMRHLLEAGADAVAAEAVAETLAHPRRNGACLAVKVGGAAGRTLVLGMLEGENGLWRSRPMVRDEAPMVELEPCSGPELAERVRAFVSSAS